MALDRHQQVARVWNWLPAFRVAAEYESLQRAGLALRVSPSALSRSIKLLEQELEVTLFKRSAAGLTLTEDGHRLLLATRDAIRRVHDVMGERALSLRAGAVPPLLPRLLCDAAMDALPNCTLGLVDVVVSEAGERLRCGDLDVVLCHEAVFGAGLECEQLPSLEMVLATAPRGSIDSRVCLEAARFYASGASVVVTTLDQLISVTERLRGSAQLPRQLLPPGWTVSSLANPEPVFMVTRTFLNDRPHPLQLLRSRLQNASSVSAPLQRRGGNST